MNRLLMKSLAAGLALTVAGTSTASAGSWDHYRRRDYSQERYYRHDDHRGEYAAIGVGLLALGLIAGMSSKTHTVTESYTY